ncbi:hypothetical protein ACFY91_05370 [Streptomyces albogriseolus]
MSRWVRPPRAVAVAASLVPSAGQAITLGGRFVVLPSNGNVHVFATAVAP